MLIEMGTRALIFLLLAACSNDQFTADDGGADVEAGAQEAAAEDVLDEASPVEGGPSTFCSTQTSFSFCDDFDVLPNVTDSFSVWTAGSIAFGTGVSGSKGMTINAAALATVSITKQVQGSVHELDFQMQLASTTLATYVTVTAGSSSFGVGVDLSPNFTIQGDSNSNATLMKADTNWHAFVVKFVGGKANVAVDSKSPVSVSFTTTAPTTSSVNLGVVVGTLGGKVTFDDVVLR